MTTTDTTTATYEWRIVTRSDRGDVVIVIGDSQLSRDELMGRRAREDFGLRKRRSGDSEYILQSRPTDRPDSPWSSNRSL